MSQLIAPPTHVLPSGPFATAATKVTALRTKVSALQTSVDTLTNAVADAQRMDLQAEANAIRNGDTPPKTKGEATATAALEQARRTLAATRIALADETNEVARVYETEQDAVAAYAMSALVTTNVQAAELIAELRGVLADRAQAVGLLGWTQATHRGYTAANLHPTTAPLAALEQYLQTAEHKTYHAVVALDTVRA